jgi:hypothetical protein
MPENDQDEVRELNLPSSPGIPRSRPQRKESNFWFWVELITGIICLLLYPFIFGFP